MAKPPEFPSELLVHLFVESYEKLTDAVRAAVVKQQNAPHAEQAAWMPWRNKVLPLFDRRLRTIQDAAGEYLAGDAAPIQRCAREECSLARNLDSYDAGFAGAETQARLEEAITLVVQAAYQVANSKKVAL